MQAAGTAAMTERPRQSEFDVQGRVRYLFSPRRIDVRERETGHLFIEPKQLIQIVDKYGRALDMSQDAFVRKEQSGDGLMVTIKTSMKIVDELLGAYGEQGLVYLEALDNLPPAVVVQIEQALLPDRAMKLPAIREHLQGMTVIPPGLASYQRQFSETRTALLAAVEQAIEWCRAVVASARNEYEGRMRGEVGIAAYTPTHKLIAAEIGEKLEEGQNINIESAGNSGDVALLAQTMVQAVAQMGQQTNAVLSQLAQQQQQTNAMLMQLITGKPLPPSAITNPDVEGEGEAPPDELLNDGGETPAPVAASVAPPKRRGR